MKHWLQKILSPRAIAAPVLSTSDQERRQGNAHLDKGDLQAAIRCYQRATELDPQSADAHISLGYGLQQANQPHAALAALTHARQLRPDNFDAAYLLGQVAASVQRPSEAVAHFEHALSLQPSFEPLYGELCQVLFQSGAMDRARNTIDNGIRLFPQNASLHLAKGNLHFHQNALEQASLSFSEAVRLDAGSAKVHQNLGFLLFRLGKPAEAEAHSRKALAIDPHNADAHNNLNALLVTKGHFYEAEQAARTACALEPASAVFQSNLGGCLLRQGRLQEAITHFQAAADLDSRHLESGSNLLFALSADPETTPSKYLAQATQVGQRISEAVPEPYTSWSTTAVLNEGCLRVGILSGHLCNGPVGYFLEGLVAHANPARIQLVAYDTDNRSDDLNQRLRLHFTEWHEVASLPATEIAKKIHGDSVQVLIDLNGHTEGNSVAVFALKPAPLQINWLGYWASTGLPTMDFVLADSICLPKQDHLHFMEQIYDLPHTRLCFTPPRLHIPVSPPPAHINGFVTFGTYQSLAKIQPGVLSVWGRVLKAVPHSRLRLTSHQISDDAFQQQFHQKLQAAGIDPNRVSLSGPLPREQYLASYAQVDIVLDTFPYTGGTTTCEALWMGVPTLTLRGNSMIGRQGVSMLSCVGLQDWIAEDEDDYVAKACAHAADIEKLNTLRLSLRERALASPLFDAPRFAKDWEDALFAMWKIKRDGTKS